MKLIPLSFFILSMNFAAPAFACDCDKNASTCHKGKEGKMACDGHDKKACKCDSSKSKDEKCSCKEEAKKAS